jgi:RNA polymerase sigma-70 factor, ECF subfamily
VIAVNLEGGERVVKGIDPEVSDDELIELYRCAYSVSLRLLGNREEARDCAQEATARALARWSKVSTYARPWVVRVSANLAVGILRKKGRVSVGLPEEGLPALSDQLEGVSDRLDLRAGLLALPVRQRQVLVMRYIGDMSEEETARALSVSLGTVKTHHRRGLKRLQARLKPGTS